jgi:hypothetical protein
MHLAATIERAEKQAILARHARRLLHLLDDTPVVPGDDKHPFEHATEARQILNDAESDLRAWEPTLEPIPTNAGEMGTNLMPKAEDGAALPAEGEAIPSTQQESARRTNLTDEGVVTESKAPQALGAHDPVTAAS